MFAMYAVHAQNATTATAAPSATPANTKQEATKANKDVNNATPPATNDRLVSTPASATSSGLKINSAPAQPAATDNKTQTLDANKANTTTTTTGTPKF